MSHPARRKSGEPIAPPGLSLPAPLRPLITLIIEPDRLDPEVRRQRHVDQVPPGRCRRTGLFVMRKLRPMRQYAEAHRGAIRAIDLIPTGINIDPCRGGMPVGVSLMSRAAA
jgi:hypothetical protein